MTVAIFSQNKFSSVDEMKSLMSNDEISKQVQGQKAKYYQIDVAKIMADLTQVGRLLKLAYAGTKKMTSFEFSVKMLTRYQRLIKDSMVTTGSFVTGSVKVLKWHKVSLSLTEKEKYATALKFLAKASTIAAKMSQISGERVKQVEELSDLTEQALVAATKDGHMEAKKREKVLAFIAETKKRQAELDSITQSLFKEIDKEGEMKAEKKTDIAANKAFITGIISAVAQPTGQLGSAVAAVCIGGGIPKSPASSNHSAKSQSSEATSSSSVSAAEDACKAAVDAKQKEIDKIKEDIRNKESDLSDAEQAEAKDELKTLKANNITKEKHSYIKEKELISANSKFHTHNAEHPLAERMRKLVHTLSLPWRTCLRCLAYTVEPLPGKNKNRILFVLAKRIGALGLAVLLIPFALLSLAVALPFRLYSHAHRPALSYIHSDTKPPEDTGDKLDLPTHNLGFGYELKESDLSDAEQAEEKDEKKINRLKEELKTLKATQEAAEKSLADLKSNLHKLSDKLDEKADSYMAVQASAAKRKAKLIAEMSKANSELAGAVEELKHLNATSSKIDRAVAALSVALKTLGKVRTTFENVRIFWKNVEKHTKALSGVYDAADLAFADAKEELIGTIYDSAIGWLTFGLNSQTALEAIKPAVKEVDAIMNDLPNDAEAANLLAGDITAALLQNIEQDNKELDSQSAQSAVANK